MSRYWAGQNYRSYSLYIIPCYHIYGCCFFLVPGEFSTAPKTISWKQTHNDQYKNFLAKNQDNLDRAITWRPAPAAIFHPEGLVI